tara:strand:- start:1300 stop:1989 length:690 start_codon:yes stop_codon:yes gene_type:complete
MDIKKFDVSELPNSSFNLFLGKRRSGKSVLCEYLINEMIKNKMLDLVFLFSKTDAGFDMIDKTCRFSDIEILHKIIANMRHINEFNKDAKKSKQIKIRTMIVVDDMAVDLKKKSFNILEQISTNGRHFAYVPCSLHFCILSQSLTKIPRVVRLNCDNMFFNNISSAVELNLLLDENFYLIDGSLSGKREGRKLYNNLVTSEDFVFVVIENHKQNVKEYVDYVKTYRAII